MRVEINEDSIRIFENQVEIVGWNQTEWIEDPNIITSIANAIHLAVTDPEWLKETLKK